MQFKCKNKLKTHKKMLTHTHTLSLPMYVLENVTFFRGFKADLSKCKREQCSLSTYTRFKKRHREKKKKTAHKWQEKCQRYLIRSKEYYTSTANHGVWNLILLSLYFSDKMNTQKMSRCESEFMLLFINSNENGVFEIARLGECMCVDVCVNVEAHIVEVSVCHVQVFITCTHLLYRVYRQQDYGHIVPFGTYTFVIEWHFPSMLIWMWGTLTDIYSNITILQCS